MSRPTYLFVDLLRAGLTGHSRCGERLNCAAPGAGSRYGIVFAPIRAASQFDLRIEAVVGEQIGAPGPAGLGNDRIDLVLRLGGGRSGGRGS